MDSTDKSLKESHVSINSLEFFGLFLTIVGMVTAIFSPRMGHMEAAMSIFGYIIIGMGVVAILGGCTVSLMNDSKKKDMQAEVELAFPAQISFQHELTLPTPISFQHGIQTITRRGSAGTSATSEAPCDENRHYNYEQVKFSSLTLSSDSIIRILPTSYPEEPPPSYYEVMRMAVISNN